MGKALNYHGKNSCFSGSCGSKISCVCGLEDACLYVFSISPCGRYARFALASWHRPFCLFPFILASARKCRYRSQGLEGDLHNYLFRQWLYSHTAFGPCYQSGMGALSDSRHLLMMKGVEERRVADSLVSLRPFPLGPRCTSSQKAAK